MSKINTSKPGETGAVNAARQGSASRTEKKSVGNAGTPAADVDLRLSSGAAAVGRLVDVMKELPDVRSERVETLRGKIAAGQFDPASDEIAAAIIKDEQ